MKQNLEAYYSCRRKKDFVTTGAVIMFLMILMFEFYLMFILPVQLTRENAMFKEVERQNITALADTLRERAWGLKTAGSLQQGERELVIGALDVLAIYIRENQERLTMEQILELKAILNRMDQITDGWKRGQFKIRKVVFDPAPILRSIEKKLEPDKP